MNTIFYHHDIHGVLCALALRTLLEGNTSTYHTSFTNVDMNKVKPGNVVYVCGLFLSLETLKNIHKKTGCDVKVYTNDPNQIMQLEYYKESYIKGVWTKKCAPLVSIWEEFGGIKYMSKLERAIANYHNWTFENSTDKLEAIAIYNRVSMERFCVDNVLDIIRMPYDKLLEEGKLISSYLDVLYEELVEDLAYWTTLEYGEDNHISGLCINAVGSSDILSKDRSAKDPKIFINYLRVVGKYRITLYSVNNSMVNVGHIAHTLSGGGKHDVAGIMCNKLPFKEKPRTTHEDKNSVYNNPYPKAHKLETEHEIVSDFTNHVASQVRPVTTKLNKLHGYNCVIINTPIHNMYSFKKHQLNFDLGMSYVFTNTGYYRIIISKLSDSVDLEELSKLLDGTIVDGSIWLYTKLLPFNI